MPNATGPLQMTLCCFVVIATAIAPQLSGQAFEEPQGAEGDLKSLLAEYLKHSEGIANPKESVTDIEKKILRASPKVRRRVVEIMRGRIQQRVHPSLVWERIDKLGWRFDHTAALIPKDPASISDKDLSDFTDIPIAVGLNLDDTGVTDVGLMSIATIPMGSLSLKNTSVSDDGIARFVKSVHDREDTVIHSELQSAGLGMFQGTSLEVLDLSGTKVGDEGVRHLAQLQNLKRLSLGGTKITNDSLPLLAKLTTLESLNLSGTQLTGKGLRLIGDLPNLECLGPPGWQQTEIAEKERNENLPRFFPWRTSAGDKPNLRWGLRRGLSRVDIDNVHNIRYLSISPNAKKMAVVSTVSRLEDRLRVRIINLETEQSQEITFEQGQELAYFCPTALSNDANLLATGDKRALSKDAAEEKRGQLVYRPGFPGEQAKPERVTIWRLPIDLTEQATPLRSFDAPWPVANLVFSPDGSKLLVNSRITAGPLLLAVIDVATGDLKTLEVMSSASLLKESMALSPNGRFVAMSNSNGVGLVDLESGEFDYLYHIEEIPSTVSTRFRCGLLLRPIDIAPPSPTMSRNCFSSDGRWLLSEVKLKEAPAGDHDRVLVYDLQLRRLAAQIEGVLGAVSGDDKTLATRDGSGNRLTLWRLQDGVPDMIGCIHNGVSNPRLSKDGKTLATFGGPVGVAQFGLWDLTEL